MEGPVSIYLRLITYNSTALTSGGSLSKDIAPVKDILDTDNIQFIKISGYSSGAEQILNIGSQSTGAGAGKITFNPFTITKFIDAVSPALFGAAASGTPFMTAEIFFVSAENIVQVMQTYKLVAVKSVSWSAASGESVIETVSFEYGGLVVTVNQQETDGNINVLQTGWNRVKNINDSDPGNVIR